MEYETRYHFAKSDPEAWDLTFVRWASKAEYEDWCARAPEQWEEIMPIDGAPWGLEGLVSCHEVKSPVLPSPQGPIHAGIEAHTIVSAMREASADLADLLFPADVEGERAVQLIPHREKYGAWRVALAGVRAGEWHHLGWFGKDEVRVPLQITLKKPTIQYLRERKCPRVPGGVDSLSEGAAHWVLEWALPMEPRIWSGAPIDAGEFEAWRRENYKNEDALASILSTNQSTINRWAKNGVPKGTSAYAVRSLMGKELFTAGPFEKFGRGKEINHFLEQFAHELSDE